MEIKKAAVIGSGVMGSGIAAHLANCGIHSLLLDIQMPDLERITKAKPAHLYSKTDIKLIKPGILDENLDSLKECDWVIEVVIEKMDIKHSLYKKIEPYLKKNSWVSSNTSGLSVNTLAEAFGPEQQKRFCVTHFFNPPRYLHLIEVVGCDNTDSGELKKMSSFLENRLGKGVVLAKDTPNFVANRIGVFSIFDLFHQMKEKGWSIPQVEKVMGPATCKAKSAVFRTADLVGLDTLALVAKTSFEGAPNDECRDRLKTPDFLQKMLDKGLLGAKSRAGFYKKEATKEIKAINLESLEYESQEKFRAPCLGKAKDIDNPAQRFKTVVLADDEAGAIAWPLMSRTLVYAANRIPEIAQTILEIDNGMRWGFGWEIGPFEMWDALGVSEVANRLEKEGVVLPALVKELLDSGANSFYKEEKGVRYYYDRESKSHKPIFFPKEIILLKSKKEQNKVVEKNGGASLIDLDDGVFGLEFHSKMNAIDDDIIGMLHKGLDRVEKEADGLLIYNEGKNFSVGANILLILLTAQQKDWEQLDKIICEFQGAMQRLRFSPKPVVAAPFQMALGGGCEVCLGADVIHAHAETYIGLVEVGVGLIPAGCGCKNLILNWEETLIDKHNPKNQIWFSPKDGGPFPKVQKSFESIAMAQVATSAKEAFGLGYCTKADSFTINRDHLLYAAKKSLLALAKNYEPPIERDNILLPGKGGKMALYSGIADFALKGLITEHDAVIGRELAHILTGGDVPSLHYASEQHILDLEREAFMRLCGMEKTLERIQHMLMQGKPLRN